MAATEPSSQALPASEAIRERDWSHFPTPRQLLALLVGYFALQVLIRTWLSSSVDLDEAEQVMLSQKFSWGYGTDPPIYTWIQMGFFALFGRCVFALALWKNLVLLATYGFVYASARRLTRSHRGGAAAALSLLFLPHMVWESQRDLTHTVLACASAAATLYSLLRAHEIKRPRGYVVLGVCVGVGLLSKVNFGFWVSGLVLAALSLREFRSTVLTRWMGLALAVSLGLVLPNWVWCLHHPELALLSSSKLGVQSSEPWLASVWSGWCHIGQAVLAFLGPLSLVYGLVFLKDPRVTPEPSGAAAGAKLIFRALLFILLALALLVTGFRATGFRERWFQPLLVCVPVLAVAWLRDCLDAERLRRMAVLGTGVMVLVALCIPGRILFMERLNREEPLARPYAELAKQIKAVLPSDTLLVSDMRVLGGNLVLALPQQRGATPELTGLFGKGAGHCALVWEANGQDSPPKKLVAWARAAGYGEVAQKTPQFFSAIYQFHHSRQYRLGLLLLR